MPLTLLRRRSDMMLPALFLTHGAGPLPLLGRQPGVAKHIQDVGAAMQRPKAILVVSAHWEVREARWHHLQPVLMNSLARDMSEPTAHSPDQTLLGLTSV